MAYDNTNTGILSRNERKEQPKHPDFNGSINVEGKEYWLSGWVKEKKDGSGKFFNLSVKAKDGSKQSAASRAENIEDMDSDLPF